MRSLRKRNVHCCVLLKGDDSAISTNASVCDASIRRVSAAAHLRLAP